ncbi:MAG: ABC transporter permease [Actinobacteria bacterium]|nr:ABC transporter permease [Actinomycetota bacterium]
MTQQALEELQGVLAAPEASGWVRRSWETMRALPAPYMIAAAVLALHLIVAITGPLWAPFDPVKLSTGPPFSRPSIDHLLGTDNFGRDVFSRVVHGERVVLLLALSASGLAVLVGASLGVTLAYLRSWIDETAMRVVDLLLTVPPLILSLLLLSALGSGYLIMIGTVAFFFALRVLTVIRAAALNVVTEDFVTAARLRGESAWSVARREVLPNVMSTVLVEFSLRTGYAVLFIGGLSFLGFGAAPPTPEWGLMISEARPYVTNAPWIVLAPSLALASLVVSLSLFTEAISEALGLGSSRVRDV